MDISFASRLDSPQGHFCFLHEIVGFAKGVFRLLFGRAKKISVIRLLAQLFSISQDRAILGIGQAHFGDALALQRDHAFVFVRVFAEREQECFARVEHRIIGAGDHVPVMFFFKQITR